MTTQKPMDPIDNTAVANHHGRDLSPDALMRIDRQHLWHPYSSMPDQLPVYAVRRASGVLLHLEDGRTLIDGMSSWWAAIHGYNVPELNRAVDNQLQQMSHVMFGGLTHRPAATLARLLIDLTPPPLDKIFLCDSGSVSVEVAIKMAIQYWNARNRPEKHKLITIRGGYHGDTFGAMALCDPHTGMHHKFSGVLARHHFIDAPKCRFHDRCVDDDVDRLEAALHDHHHEIAALILEPVVQGAGGMWFYSPQYLNRARSLCDRYDILLIFDEIATGFGRTGKLFAVDHTRIQPDIMCLGKSLTGGYISLAATLTTGKIARGLCAGGSALMHGPTFMANPLACCVANASIELLLNSPWQQRVGAIEKQLQDELKPCAALDTVADVRVLGAIGVVELNAPVEMAAIQAEFVDHGVWIRPFGRLVYLMPPYIIDTDQLRHLTSTIYQVLHRRASD
jgi:adenosylmethionine-8-amino-7-oxononanoate aminotransferase